MKKQVSTNKAPAAIGPYSQGIISNNLIFCSGQIPLDLNSNIAVNVKSQAKQVLDNLSEVLKAAGSDFSKVVKTTIFLKDLDHFSEVNEIYQSYFSMPYPARSTIEVSKLPKDVLVEIEAIAFLN